MSHKLEIVFFDLKDNNKENNEENNHENNEDNGNKSEIFNKENSLSYKIIEHFINNNVIIDLEKEECGKFNIYSFIYQIQKGIARQFKFYLFNGLCEEAFKIDSNGIFIFCELNNEKTKELLEEFIEYVKKTCPQDIKIFIVGIISSRNQNNLNKLDISELIKENEIDYKYKEINLNDNQDNNNDENKINNEKNNIVLDDKNDKNSENEINNKEDVNNQNNQNEIIINNEVEIKIEENIIEDNNKGIILEENKNDNFLNEIKDEIYEKFDELIVKSLLDIYQYKKKKQIDLETDQNEDDYKNQSHSRCLLI